MPHKPEQHATIITALAALAILCAPPCSAQAQNLPDLNKPVGGMKKIIVTPQDGQNHPQQKTLQQNAAPDATTKTAPETPEQSRPPLPNSLDAKESLVRPDKLKPWGNLSLAATAQNKKDAIKLIAEIENHRSIVSPQGLLLSAKSLFDAGEKEQAAIYLFVAQLRLEFDKSRWPTAASSARLSESRQQTALANARKTQDQSLPTAKNNTQKKPQSYTEALMASISPPIFQWAIKNPARFRSLIEQAKTWDEATKYEYKPDYGVKETVPFEEWENLLVTTREKYFLQMTGLQQALEKY